MSRPAKKNSKLLLSSTPTLKGLAAVTHGFAGRLRRDFTQDITRDPSAFKKAVLRLVRRELPPRRGRPNDPRIDAAVRMVEQGKTVKDVLHLQVPGFDRLDTYGRYLAEKGLRAAIARRRTTSSDLQRNVR